MIKFEKIHWRRVRLLLEGTRFPFIKSQMEKQNIEELEWYCIKSPYMAGIIYLCSMKLNEPNGWYYCANSEKAINISSKEKEFLKGIQKKRFEYFYKKAKELGLKGLSIRARNNKLYNYYIELGCEEDSLEIETGEYIDYLIYKSDAIIT